MDKNHPFIKDSKSIFSICHLNDVEKNITQSVIKAYTSHEIVHNVIITQNGLCLTKDNVVYLSNIILEMTLKQELNNLSNADKFINYFKDNKFDYHLVWIIMIPINYY